MQKDLRSSSSTDGCDFHNRLDDASLTIGDLDTHQHGTVDRDRTKSFRKRAEVDNPITADFDLNSTMKTGWFGNRGVLDSGVENDRIGDAGEPI